jgi:PHD/YefM family antitoxin component YafN of YafNO toxin-antitoxin module
MSAHQVVLEVELTREQIISAIRRMKQAERREFIEDLLAATSPAYLSSIREARADRRAGRVKSLKEVFGE